MNGYGADYAIKNRGGAVSEDVFTVSKNIKGVKLRARATGELTTTSLNLEATLKKASATTKTTSSNGFDDDIPVVNP